MNAQLPIPGDAAARPIETSLQPAQARSASMQVCSFWLADRLFGVNILDVKEINKEVGFTRVYHAPKEVRGYVNIRGQIYLVLDLQMILGFEVTPVTAASRVVLFKPSVAESLGVLVDRVSDIVQVAEGQVEWRDQPVDEHSRDNRRSLIAGDCKLPGKLITLLDSRRLLGTILPS